eukprot:TRINITY_DN11125_c0_g1_i2.p2 TRINITY_DN11125_c0_g1~~TRINITY_DN11125_c0_g1_i2.p2  ORF type:complete len:134 (+),score=50.51 TRINITY_DN11125_c0_g1_i2:74-475(+)
MIFKSAISLYFIFFFLMIRLPPRSTQGVSSAASDVYKRQILDSFAKNISRFFKTSSNSLLHLANIEEKIKQGAANMKKIEDDKKEEEVRKIKEMMLKEKEEEEQKLKAQLAKEKELEEKNQKRNYGERVQNAN